MSVVGGGGFAQSPEEAEPVHRVKGRGNFIEWLSCSHSFTAESADSLTALATSRYRILRELGDARWSIYKYGTLTPVPVWVELVVVFALIGLATTAYFALIVQLCLQSVASQFKGHIRWQFGGFIALCLIIAIILPCHGVNLYKPMFCYDPELTVHRGNALRLSLQRLHRTHTVHRFPGFVDAFWRKRSVQLVDFRIVDKVMEIRLAFKFVVIVLNLSGAALFDSGSIDEVIIHAMMTSSTLITTFLLLDSILSASLGAHSALIYRMGRRLRKRNEAAFDPMDPRAFMAQNAVFSFLLGLPSACLLYMYIFRGNDDVSDSDASWMLCAIAAIMSALLGYIGARLCYCPAALLVGCLVKSEKLPMPLPAVPEGSTVILNYSIHGPVLHLDEGELLPERQREPPDSGSSCLLCKSCVSACVRSMFCRWSVPVPAPSPARAAVLAEAPQALGRNDEDDEGAAVALSVLPVGAHSGARVAWA